VVGFHDDPVLDVEPLVRKVVGRPLERAADAAQRVEGHDERDAERALDLRRHEPRHPEVRVHQLVAPAPAPADRVGRELVHVWQEVFLAHEFRGPGRDVHDADPIRPLRGLGQERAVPARQHVDLVAEGPEVTRELTDVHVLAAGVDAAQHRER
jgi:hypothetical protein